MYEEGGGSGRPVHGYKILGPSFAHFDRKILNRTDNFFARRLASRKSLNACLHTDQNIEVIPQDLGFRAAVRRADVHQMSIELSFSLDKGGRLKMGISLITCIEFTTGIAFLPPQGQPINGVTVTKLDSTKENASYLWRSHI